MTDSAKKLDSLRKAMLSRQLAALIIPSNDPHQSEYVGDHWKSREWISGFTGSAGVAVVTLETAGLWTDSRYFLQAAQELEGGEVTFYKQSVSGAPEHYDWIKTKLKSGDRLGIDGKLLSIETMRGLESAFAGTGIEIVTDFDPVAEAWLDRPLLPETPIFAHEANLAGRSCQEKLAEIRKEMQNLGANTHLVVTLDDIAWIFNLRGRDVEYNPVFYAFALIDLENAILFVEPAKVPDALKSELAKAGVAVQPYNGLSQALSKLNGSVLIDPGTVSVFIEKAFGAECKQIHAVAPSTAMKAKKDSVELGHIRRAMEKDGVALLRLVRWMENALKTGNLTEFAVGEQLASFRAEQAGYFGESFPAIAGYAGNGAIVHYRPAASGSATLQSEGVFLLDSGGQYRDGTTDITRTFALGAVPSGAAKAYTLVLKGHIGLAKAKFPAGTTGYQLDPLARMHLWSAGLNYGHGTGHGVGYFLNVHEGPQGIAPVASPRSRTALEPGMIISNEPGFYEPDRYGIRIENLVLVVEAESTRSGKFFAFETLSLFPIESTMIEWELLDRLELEWLKTYHAEVQRRLNPLLEPEEREWLAVQCAPYLR
ncbi:MAG: aminopeptidase P family protein [Bacteroidetes bacterium]|nr:aminopeptidase P family protein [Bacteroidota bacterium]